MQYVAGKFVFHERFDIHSQSLFYILSDNRLDQPKNQYLPSILLLVLDNKLPPPFLSRLQYGYDFVSLIELNFPVLVLVLSRKLSGALSIYPIVSLFPDPVHSDCKAIHMEFLQWFDLSFLERFLSIQFSQVILYLFETERLE